jgi:hypothetical protein
VSPLILMKKFSSLGLVLAGLYLLVSGLLIWQQGLFGESFIAILLGFPWSFALAFFEYGNVSGAMIYVLVLGPLVLNAVLLYWIGAMIGKRTK